MKLLIPGLQKFNYESLFVACKNFWGNQNFTEANECLVI